MKTIFLTVSALVLFAAGTPANAETQHDFVIRTADGTPVGDATLNRHSNRITAIVRTTDLDPGAAVTVWWRIYNRPQHCALPYACEAGDLSNPGVDGSQLHATGFVVEDAGGRAAVVATLYRTAVRAQGGQPFADSLDEAYLNGPGLRRPLTAEVELLLASHGRVADPALDGSQAAIDQLITPGGTAKDCSEAGVDSPGRTFRCGVIQRVDHSGR